MNSVNRLIAFIILFCQLQRIREKAFPTLYFRLRRYPWHLPLYYGSAARDRDALPHRNWQRHNELHLGIGPSCVASAERRFDRIDWRRDRGITRAHHD